MNPSATRRRSPWTRVALPCMLAIAATPAPAQSPQLPPVSVPVYVEGSGDQLAPGVLGSLGRVGAEIAMLELLRSPLLRAVQSGPPPCTSTPVPTGGASGTAAEPFYAIELNSVSTAEMLRLSARVSRCDGGRFDSVATHTAGVTSAEALPALLALAGAAVQTVHEDLPRQPVSLGPLVESGTLATGARVAADALQHLENTLWDTPGFEPAESAALVVDGVLEPAGARRVTARIRAGPRAAPQVFQVEGSLDSLPEFYAQLAQLAVDRLIRATRVSANAPEPPAQLLAEARRRACLDGPGECTPDASGATALLRLALERDSLLVPAWILLGKVHTREGRRSDAMAALDRALALARDAATERDALNALAALHAGAGEYDPALALYDRSLRIDPAQPEVATARAWVLGASGRSIDLLRFASRPSAPAGAQAEAAAGTLPGAPADAGVFGKVLRSVSREMVRDSVETIRLICAMMDEVRTDCAHALHEHAVALYNAGEDPELVRPVFHAALALDSRSASRTATAYGYVAASFLGGFSRWHVTGGRRARTLTPFEPDSVDHYLGLAEALPRASLTDADAEWITRVRAAYWRNRGDYARARERARAAFALRPSPSAVLLEAETYFDEGRRLDRDGRGSEAGEAHARAFALADSVLNAGSPFAYSVYRLAGHRLGRDGETRARFEGLVARRPRDVQAHRALAYVCAEYLRDYQCGHDAFAALDVRGQLSGPADSLQAAEYAVLADDLDRAAAFLGNTAAGLDHCRAAVAFFYGFWLAAQSDAGTAARETAHGRWAEALRGFRSSGSAGCWDFSGAVARLNGPAPPREAARMLEMLHSFQRP